MTSKKVYRFAFVFLLLSITLLLVILYANSFIYMGVINPGFLLIAISLLGLSSYNMLRQQRTQAFLTHKSIRALYMSIIIVVMVFIVYIRYLPKFTYMQAYNRIEKDLSTRYSNINLVRGLGNFTRSYPYNFLSNKTYIYTIEAGDEEIFYYFNQYTGEYYEIEGIEGTLYRKYSKTLPDSITLNFVKNI